MELIIGQTHRNVLALASSRSYLFLGDHFFLRKLSVARVAGFHRTAWFRNRHDLQNDPLTLSSLEVKHKAEPEKKDKVLNLRNWKPSAKVSSSKAKPASNARSKPAGARKPLKIDESLFSAKTFGELGLPPLLVDRLEKEGLTAPTEVQSAAIPAISQDHDVVIQSYTGSGKTLAYLLPILSEVGPLKTPAERSSPDQKPGIEAVVVAPSRELGMQIVREVERLLGPADKKLVQQLVGGANRSRQEEALKKNKPVIVVGTPGRIAEISAAGKLHTHGCRFLVLDEVDQLLSFNYREDMHRIIEHVGRRSGTKPSNILGPLAKRTERQTIMVSATIPFSVVRAARSWGRDPVLVRAKSVLPLDSVSTDGPVPFKSNPDTTSSSSSATQGAIDSLPPNLEHYYCVSKAQHKVDTLRRCVHALSANTVIVFMNNTKPLKDVVFKLEARGMKAAELHGDLGKLARSTVLKKFKDGEMRVLVTNELSARGLDVPECDLVVNLDLPTDSIHYAHRAGRTGRLGRKGNVVTICEEPEVFVVKKLRKQLSVAIKPCELAEGNLVVQREEEVE
ncbi:DEAD-box ATP-dependent RNA helicase 47A [Ananas comosus]|uniref:RNA helicase n=1 Tax=Ananas comosus TaxID=4615 RepID=A0A199VS25_ANACO|nr:DEAD-box ATP-dependent RNA helicase 47A [Ananas comosus]